MNKGGKTILLGFVAGAVFLLSALPPVPVAAAEDQFETQRQKLLNRERRIISNNDGNEVLYWDLDKAITPENVVKLRTTKFLEAPGVTVSYCPVSSGFGYFTHNTKVGDVLVGSDSPYHRSHNTTNAAGALIAQGTDALKAVVDFCRTNDIEVFFSIRMNDTHDQAHTAAKPYLLFPPIKQRHPEYLMGAFTNRPPYGAWSAVDYTNPEVRDYAYRFIEEVCRNYDVDGVEMDFFRHLQYFKTVSWGGKATQAELDMMTELMQRVRAMTEREGRKRGRPILTAIRVPDSVEYSRAMGFDLERWLAEGLVDILIGACYFQLNDWGYLVRLGHRYGAKVYPGLSDPRVQGEIPPFKRAALVSYRARAAQIWASGADGVYTFNFTPKASWFHELGDPQALAGLDKTYFATVMNASRAPSGYLAGGADYMHLPVLTPDEPMQITPGAAREVEVMIGDDLPEAVRQGLNPAVTCNLRGNLSDNLSVSLNGVLLKERRQTNEWLELPLPVNLVRKGANRFRFVYDAKAAEREDKEWNEEWTAEKMPAGAWYHSDFRDDLMFAKLQDGAMLVADRDPDGALYFTNPWSAPSAEEVVAEVKVKVVSGFNSVFVTTDTATECLTLFPDHIGAHYAGLRYDMDTTNDFHTYRIVLKGKDLKVYVDGELRLNAAGKFTHINTWSRNNISFGGGYQGSLGNYKGEALWQAVRFKVPGQGLQIADMVVSVDFLKKQKNTNP